MLEWIHENEEGPRTQNRTGAMQDHKKKETQGCIHRNKIKKAK